LQCVSRGSILAGDVRCDSPIGRRRGRGHSGRGRPPAARVRLIAPLGRRSNGGRIPAHTLQATASVHEAYLRLVGANPPRTWESRGHFFAAAAEAMRRILINCARDKGRDKRSGIRRRLDQAIVEYRIGFAIDPKAKWSTSLVEALEVKGYLDEALAVYERHAALNPTDGFARYALGCQYARRSRWGQAAAAFQEGTRLASTLHFDAWCHRELAWLHATCSDAELRDPTRALQSAEVVVRMGPKEGRDWNAVGAARYRAGDPASAVAALLEGNRVSSGGGGASWLILALAHLKLEKKEDARKWYDAAVRLSEDNKRAENTLTAKGSKDKWRTVEPPAVKETFDRLRAEAAEVLDIADSPGQAAKEAPPKKKP